MMVFRFWNGNGTNTRDFLSCNLSYLQKRYIQQEQNNLSYLLLLRTHIEQQKLSRLVAYTFNVNLTRATDIDISAIALA
jgi:hypothetical protein